MSAKTEHIPALTGLRGVFALWVLMLHITMLFSLGFRLPFEEYVSPFLATFFWAGYLAVDGFFILSGFVLSYVYAQQLQIFNVKPTLKFLTLRLARIYPVHLFMLLVYALLLWGIEWPMQHACFPVDPQSNCDRFSIESFWKNMALVHAWDWFPKTSWNVNSWSISSEWAAYILFPFIIPFIVKLRNSFIIVIGAILPLILMVLFIQQASHAEQHLLLFQGMLKHSGNNFAADIFASSATKGALEFGLIRISTEFISGCFLFNFFQSRWFAKVNWAKIGLLSLLGIIIVIQYLPIYLCYFLLLLLLLSLLDKNTVSFLLGTKPMVWLGKISYSIYMVHSLVIQLMAGVIASLILDDAGPPEQFEVWLAILAIIVVTIAIGAMVFYLIEEISRKKIKHFFTR